MFEVAEEINKIQDVKFYGQVSKITGLLVECVGLEKMLSIGARCKIHRKDGTAIITEVVRLEKGCAQLLPFERLDGISIGDKVEFFSSQIAIQPSAAWLGRVVNCYGEPIDDKGILPTGKEIYPIKANPPPANRRKRVGAKINLGVKAMNVFTSCCDGQRMGIFAGSGVGKSMLMSMLARYSDAQVNVSGLIGERGREVQEFIEDYLGEEGLKRSVVVVATSDEPALARKYAAYVTLAISEYFRDQDKKVFCMIDSVTRFAMAQREIGLAAGEPPTSKGYTPSVFAELPRLLERAGPGVGEGSITGLFSVLVEGSDMDEPVADAVRGILDGHIVLERKISERGRYPSINILRSVSRTMPNCNSDWENALVMKSRGLMSAYEDMEEMIRIGAYRKGADPLIDEAIAIYPKIEAFMNQKSDENFNLENSYQQLAEILGMTKA